MTTRHRRLSVVFGFVALFLPTFTLTEIATYFYFKTHLQCYPFQENLLGRPFSMKPTDSPLSRNNTYDRETGWEPYYPTPFRQRELPTPRSAFLTV